MAPTPTLQELIEIVRQDSPSDDPLDQLATAAATVADLSEVGDAVLGYHVDRARHAGASWTAISAALGVSKQAAHKRFAAATRPPGLDRFTDRARRVLSSATEVARGLGHAYVGTEHLLLALYTDPVAPVGPRGEPGRVGGGLAAEVLRELGLDRETAQARVVEKLAELVRSARGNAHVIGGSNSGPFPALLLLRGRQDGFPPASSSVVRYREEPDGEDPGQSPLACSTFGSSTRRGTP